MKKRCLAFMVSMLIICLCVPTISMAETYKPVVVGEYNGNTYAVFEENMDWNSAEKYCREIGGHLVTITSGGEQMFVEYILDDCDDKDYFIGLHRELNDLQTWVTGERVMYSNWGEGEPDDAFGGQEFGVIANGERSGGWYKINKGQWDDVSNKGPFICEWDADIPDFVKKNEIVVFIDGIKIEFDQPPVILNDRVMVPMRKIFESMGYNVEWYDETKIAVARKGSLTISVKVGSKEIQYGNGTYICDVAPEIIDGRTLVPVRAIAECAGCDVIWNSNEEAVMITTNIDNGDVLYTTRIIDLEANTLDEWANEVESYERGMVGLTANQAIIVDREILEYKDIDVKIPYVQGVGLDSEYKRVTMGIPSKIKYTLHTHKMENKVDSTFVGALMAGLVEQKLVWTQSCECGYKNQLEWIIPLDGFNNKYTGDELYVRTESKVY